MVLGAGLFVLVVVVLIGFSLLQSTFTDVECTKKQAVKNTKLFGFTTRPVPGTMRGRTAIPNAGATENTKVITPSKIEKVSWVYQDGEFTTAISNLCLRTTICSRSFHITPRQGSHHILLFWMTSEHRACLLLLCYFCNDAVHRKHFGCSDKLCFILWYYHIQA